MPAPATTEQGRITELRGHSSMKEQEVIEVEVRNELEAFGSPEVQVLSPRQQRALLALLSEPSIEAAMRKAEIPNTTMFRWLKEPTFQAALQQVKNYHLQQTLTGLQCASQSAVATLQEVASNPVASNSEKVSAAKAILDFNLKATGTIKNNTVVVSTSAEPLRGAYRTLCELWQKLLTTYPDNEETRAGFCADVIAQFFGWIESEHGQSPEQTLARVLALSSDNQ